MPVGMKHFSVTKCDFLPGIAFHFQTDHTGEFWPRLKMNTPGDGSVIAMGLIS